MPLEVRGRGRDRISFLGAACIFAAFAVSLWIVWSGVRAARTGEWRYTVAARRGVYALCGLLTTSVILLEIAFLTSDFGVRLVAHYSSTTTPTLFKVTAMWSSQAGSLLLWAWVLSIATSAVLYFNRDRHRDLLPVAIAVLGGLAVFFTGLMVWGAFYSAAESFPFTTLDPAPMEGRGLNPLLRHPAMAIHPPMLYSGYVFFSIPFAFAISALWIRRLDTSWIRLTRRYALIAWTFLTAGIVLGANWSYSELGWGGYWGWDPVENASLMPWLIGTAYLHSIMVQEKRGMLRTWNVSLIVATFTLCLTGTFLVRSGVLESIHAFGLSKVGGPLLVLISIVVIGSAVLISSRRDQLRAPKRIESPLSREAVFLVNNLLLLALCAVIFWGTFFPLISELFTGVQRSVGPPFFSRVTTPLAILLVLFTGIGPLLAWRKMNWSGVWHVVRLPLAIAVVACVVLTILLGTDSVSSLVLFTLAAFTLSALAQEVLLASRARHRATGGGRLAAVGAVVGGNRRRYGGYIVHTGFVLLLIGVAASSAFQHSADVRLAPGETARVGAYDFTYTQPGASVDATEQKLTFSATVLISRDGRAIATVHPERNYYSSLASESVRSFFEGEATSEVGRVSGFTRDLWTAMRPDLSGFDDTIEEADEQIPRLVDDVGGEELDAATRARLVSQLQGTVIRSLQESYLEDSPPVDFRINVNPLVSWIWVGAIVMVCGALFSLIPSGRRRRQAGVDAAAAELAGGDDPEREARIAELMAVKAARLEEIRELRLDFEQGKLDEEEWKRQDSELRRAAIDSIKALDDLGASASKPPADSDV